MTKQIPWVRITAEGVAIVVSILLAFGIQAWWERAEERRDVREALQAVLGELDAAREDLEFAGRNHQRRLSNTEVLLAILESSQMDETLVVSDTLLVGLFGQSVSEPPTAVVGAFISSGFIDQLSSGDLRRSLLSWIPLVEDQRDDEVTSREFQAGELQPYLRAEFDVISAQRQRMGLGGDPDREPSATVGRGDTEIRSTMRFRNLVSWQLRWLRLNTRQSGELVRHGEDLDGMVRAEIR